MGLADALVHEPELLILDEPTSGLDPSQRREVRDLIASLKERHTVLISSHILPEIENSCERVIVISNGGVVAQQTISSLKSFNDRDHFFIVLRGEEIPVRAAIDEISGVELRGVDVLEEGRLRLGLATDDRRHGRSRCLSALVTAGQAVHELGAEDDSLESAFLRLIERDKGSAE